MKLSAFKYNLPKTIIAKFPVSPRDNAKLMVLDRAANSDIIKLSVEKIYRSQEVVEKEISGYRIISDILEVYTAALVRKKEGRASNYDQLMISTLPEHYRDFNNSLYNILLNACCFVASLSDGAAVHIHNKITGKQL